MRFEITPEEAQPLAVAVVNYLKQMGMNVRIEQPAFDGAPYRTTVVAEKSGRKVLIEVQSTLGYGRSQKDLARWLAAERCYAEFYIATGAEAILTAGALHEMKNDGVGLYIVDDGAVAQHHRARNPALVVSPDPTLSLGPLKTQTGAAVRKFNETDRKDGLRDMCQIVEHLTEHLGVIACKRGRLKIPEDQFRRKDWSSQINELARPEAYNYPYKPIIKPALKDDLHSFRGARNLVDHPATSHSENKRTEMQFAERMMQGPRLAAELLSLRRNLR